jgi:hypothetical protein
MLLSGVWSQAPLLARIVSHWTRLDRLRQSVSLWRRGHGANCDASYKNNAPLPRLAPGSLSATVGKFRSSKRVRLLPFHEILLRCTEHKGHQTALKSRRGP